MTSSLVTRGHSWSLVVTLGHSWSTRGHSWSFVVTRGHSCVLLDLEKKGLNQLELTDCNGHFLVLRGNFS